MMTSGAFHTAAMFSDSKDAGAARSVAGKGECHRAARCGRRNSWSVTQRHRQRMAQVADETNHVQVEVTHAVQIGIPAAGDAVGAAEQVAEDALWAHPAWR